ncbi:TetR/AcrR family transcriptional regulator [Nocardioides speluncae]|uniref:TetR/AcrR family transcriptional regulator n=1 Tax=Nocardioides speluncae TaxID=2670337 RepID=UPI001981CFDA|nr:TetR/AcrR family transcriptional regulator [Nocardioides speluncae]
MSEAARKPAPMSGRKAQAARNDEAILEAARAVFIANPEAPIANVAERAGVGISALYRRYPSKEELLAKLCLDGLRTYVAVAEEAVADEGDAWESFARFMRNAVDAGTSALTVKLAGTFTPTQEHWEDSVKAFELNRRLMERTRAAGVIREDFELSDMAAIFELLSSYRLGDEQRSAELRQRYLEVILDGIRIPPSHSPLPAEAPTEAELSARWAPK